jgi:hypothetical protein
MPVGIGFRVAVVQVVQLLFNALKIADSVPVAVLERTHENFVEDHIIPPARNIFRLGSFRARLGSRGGCCGVFDWRGRLRGFWRGLAGSQQQSSAANNPLANLCCFMRAFLVYLDESYILLEFS